MKNAPTQQPQCRAAILAAGRVLFKRHGFDGVGVDAIASRAGLTSGALYRHFASKQDLFLEVLRAEMSELPARIRSRMKARGVAGLERWIAGYLGLRHVDDVAEGCVLPSLTLDTARAGPEAQALYGQMLAATVAGLCADLPKYADEAARARLWGLVALLSGAVTLARGAGDGATAEDILAGCRSTALALLRCRPADH